MRPTTCLYFPSAHNLDDRTPLLLRPADRNEQVHDLRPAHILPVRVRFDVLKIHSLSPRGRFSCRHLNSRDIAEHSVTIFHHARDPRPYLSRLPGAQPVHPGFGPRLHLFGSHHALCCSRTVAFNVELRLGGRSDAHVWHPEFGSAHRRVRADPQLLDDLIPEHRAELHTSSQDEHSDLRGLHHLQVAHPINHPPPRYLYYKHIRPECGRRGGPQVK